MSKLLECNGSLRGPLSILRLGRINPSSSGNIAIQFLHQGETLRKTAMVTIQFLPRKELLLTCLAKKRPGRPASSRNLTLYSIGRDLIRQGRCVELILPDRAISLDAYCISADENRITFTPKRSTVSVTPPSDRLSTVLFHIFNFPDFCHGPDDYAVISQGVKICGRAILRADGWKITVAATDKTPDLVKYLRQEGGYVVTHMGKIERADGSGFSTEQVEPLLFCVNQFLSFALGRRAGTALPLGFDAEGHRVFEQWDLPAVTHDAWCGSSSWFDERHGELLSEVFPGFFTLWNNGSWKEHLRTSLFWYLSANEHSNDINVDAGTILAQTALERLAWAQCVEQSGTVPPKAFLPGGLSAAKRIRLLASALGIPTELPPKMAALNTQCGKKWADIPEAVTSIRNASCPSIQEGFTSYGCTL